MNEDTHFAIGREFVAIHALLDGVGIDPRQPYTYSCGQAVQELAKSAMERLDGVLDEPQHDDYEIHIARAMLAAIAMFALVGYASYALHPDGCTNGGPGENPFTPLGVDARAYASLLCDLAGERWPAKAEWFVPVAELAAARKDGER